MWTITIYQNVHTAESEIIIFRETSENALSVNMIHFWGLSDRFQGTVNVGSHLNLEKDRNLYVT